MRLSKRKFKAVYLKREASERPLSMDFIWQSLQQLYIEIVILTTNMFQELRPTILNLVRMLKEWALLSFWWASFRWSMPVDGEAWQRQKEPHVFNQKQSAKFSLENLQSR